MCPHNETSTGIRVFHRESQVAFIQSILKWIEEVRNIASSSKKKIAVKVFFNKEKETEKFNIQIFF